jgi:tetratricopeptide (TPR) repeat protein
MNLRAFVVMTIVATAACGQVSAQPSGLKTWCTSPDATNEQTIAGCTADIQSGDYDAANLSAIYTNRGLAYDSEGQYDLAIQDYDQAVKLAPWFADGFKSRGDAYQDKGEYQRAIADYDSAIEDNPKFAQAFQNRAIAKRHLGDNAGADADDAKAKQLSTAP